MRKGFSPANFPLFSGFRRVIGVPNKAKSVDSLALS
jgi:hypothetical protein